MARIAGIDIPRDKRVVVSLTYVYGIGRTTAEEILATCGIDESIRVKDLSEDQENQLRQLYTKTYELYQANGNNSAQDYTLGTVVPYLKSIGISSSYTDKYKSDVGYPDFLKDYEDGVFNSSSGGTSSGGRSYTGGGRSFAIGLDYVPSV